MQKGAAHVEGNINGIPCQIVPNTGAEITIVPACYVYEDQAINEWVKVRGWNSEPQTLQLAKVDFEYEGKSFLSTVAVAHEDNLCNRVFFSVPMDGEMASRLLLDAASNSTPMVDEAEQPGDTPGIQTSPQKDDCSVSTSVEASKTSQSSADTQESHTTVRERA